MPFDRSNIVAHADDYWWRPCQDGLVWVKNDRITISTETARRKLHGWGGAFLWYDGETSVDGLEGLFLLPASKLPLTQDAPASRFPEAVMIASYNDDATTESQAIKNLRLRFAGLNDCTHFTSECLIAGGFAVTDEHARRGAPQLYQYLFDHRHTKVLGDEVSKADASKVIAAGLLKEGDVIVYTNQSDNLRHHGVVYIGEGKIAMHTWHQITDWDDAGGESQLYSLFHISYDDDFAAAAGRWAGWWQITQGGAVRYYYVHANGHIFSTNKKPSSTKDKPVGPDYWFPDGNTMRVCMRGTAVLEQYVMSPGAAPDTPVSGTLLNGTGSQLLNALKIP